MKPSKPINMSIILFVDLSWIGSIASANISTSIAIKNEYIKDSLKINNKNAPNRNPDNKCIRDQRSMYSPSFQIFTIL